MSSRFAGTSWVELDQDREQAWRYRDYIVKSLNEDKPYDRFIREQLAGDELAPDDFEMRVAIRLSSRGRSTSLPGNLDQAVNRQEWLTEVMFESAMELWELTSRLAVPRSEFDPILQSDFYRLQSFFAAARQRRLPAIDKCRSGEAASRRRSRTPGEAEADQGAARGDRETLSGSIEGREGAKLRTRSSAGALAKPAEQRSELEQLVGKGRAANAQRQLGESCWPRFRLGIKARRASLRQQMHRINLFSPEPLPKALAVSDALSPVHRCISEGRRSAPSGRARFGPVYDVPAASARLRGTPRSSPVARRVQVDRQKAGHAATG
jgi:hypothetical protein